MISRCLVPLFLCLFTVTPFAAEPSFDRARLLGTWEFQLPGSLTSFTGYTTFRPDGTCVQIGRGKTLGMTKWIYVETQWRLEGDQVVASVTRSSIGLPNGKSTTSRIIRLTASEFTYREAGDSADRTEHRIAQVPPDFQRQLADLQQKANGK
jgi:hypothetical protein